MSLKIAIVGAGSIGFTRRLLRDFLLVPEFRDTEFRFQDISATNLDMVARLCRRDIEANDLQAHIVATEDREIALRDADYVINTARVGGLEAFKTDVEIPLRYGIDQCVGDTICAGGLMYGQRTVPMVVELCHQIERFAKPNAILLNYANPMAMNTWAALDESGVETIGLCHGVQGGHRLLAALIERHVNQDKQEDDVDFQAVTKQDVDIVAVGINHQTWYMHVVHEGIDWATKLHPLFEAAPDVAANEKVRMDMIRRFGYFSTESNGHLSEYVPWYRKRPDEIPEWTSMAHWIHGESAGYLRVCTENRNWFEQDFPRWLKEEPWKLDGATRSDEHGSWIVEAIETGRTYRGHFNIRNHHTVTNLPTDCVVEVPGYVDRNGMSIPQYGDLPLGCAAICNNSIQVQRMAKDAALTGDVELLKQACLLDPLVGAVCNPPEVWHMVDAMLVAQAEWLPQYTDAIPEAQRRLANSPDLSNSTSNGAMRREVRTIEEMRAQQA
ncbi:MAG: alpha-galactosidase [Gammaproteobacteria bacterium]|nr:alpha-galactosidase [Gammaproteobacteria bacterium]